VQYDWLSKEAAILKRGYFDARERCERYSRIPDGADAEKGAVEKKLHSVDRWEDLERRRLRLAERCRAWMPDVAEALPEMSRPRDERLDQGATEGELRKIEIEACSRFDADLETRSGQYPVSRALNRLRANLNLALLQFLLIGEEDGKYPTDNACAEYRDAHARAREICRRGQALPALPAPVNDPQRDLRGLYDWCGDAMARWRLSKPTDAEDAPAAAAPEQGEGKAGSLVPILCPYDGPLAAALRRRCPDVKEAHDELGSLRDYKQALFVQSLPVIMEWPPDPWFDLPEGAEPRPCAWDRLLFEAPAEDEQGEDTSPLAAFMKHARRLPEQPPEYTENILWDSQPVASFAAECQRAGKPLALGQWSDPLRIGRAWGSQTGFLEQHQHGDLASGIVQGRFIAVAFVDRVLVDPRFRQWCVLWEEYRKTGEVPVLAHEKAARDIGAAIPERKTVWDHLPYVIGLNCPILYTAAALHYLLPVKGDAVEYGPVCSDGVAFDFNRVGIGEAIRNPRQAEGVNWLSDDAMKLFGLAEVMVRAAGSESAVAKMYGITAAEVSVLPLVTSQAGDPLGVAFKIGQGGVLVLPGCWSLMAKADMIRRLASDFWAPMRQWLRDTGEPAVRGGDSSNARKAEEPKEEPPQEERGPANCFLPRGHFWEVRYGEEEGHLKASKGMQRIYQLLRQRDNPKPVSALALVGADEELAKLDQTFEPILDRKAKAAFRDEIASLDSRIEVAEQNDDASAAHLREERGKIVADFMNAHGLGRRDRKLGSASPAAKAANAVRTTLARTYGVMRKADPPMKALAAHLSESIQSEGNAFAYRPAPETSAWDL
jgi:hypothetical protein